jgi:hypothetical protein
LFGVRIYISGFLFKYPTELCANNFLAYKGDLFKNAPRTFELFEGPRSFMSMHLMSVMKIETFIIKANVTRNYCRWKTKGPSVMITWESRIQTRLNNKLMSFPQHGSSFSVGSPRITSLKFMARSF